MKPNKLTIAEKQCLSLLKADSLRKGFSCRIDKGWGNDCVTLVWFNIQSGTSQLHFPSMNDCLKILKKVGIKEVNL